MRTREASTDILRYDCVPRQRVEQRVRVGAHDVLGVTLQNEPRQSAVPPAVPMLRMKQAKLPHKHDAPSPSRAVPLHQGASWEGLSAPKDDCCLALAHPSGQRTNPKAPRLPPKSATRAQHDSDIWGWPRPYTNLSAIEELVSAVPSGRQSRRRTCRQKLARVTWQISKHTHTHAASNSSRIRRWKARTPCLTSDRMEDCAW